MVIGASPFRQNSFCQTSFRQTSFRQTSFRQTSFCQTSPRLAPFFCHVWGSLQCGGPGAVEQVEHAIIRQYHQPGRTISPLHCLAAGSLCLAAGSIYLAAGSLILAAGSLFHKKRSTGETRLTLSHGSLHGSDHLVQSRGKYEATFTSNPLTC